MAAKSFASRAWALRPGARSGCLNGPQAKSSSHFATAHDAQLCELSCSLPPSWAFHRVDLACTSIPTDCGDHDGPGATVPNTMQLFCCNSAYQTHAPSTSSPLLGGQEFVRSAEKPNMERTGWSRSRSHAFLPPQPLHSLSDVLRVARLQNIFTRNHPTNRHRWALAARLWDRVNIFPVSPSTERHLGQAPIPQQTRWASCTGRAQRKPNAFRHMGRRSGACRTFTG